MDLTCDTCGRTFTAKRSDAKTCSPRCRTTAYRVRRDGPKPRVRRAPIQDSIRGAYLDLYRTAGRWERLAKDDRFARAMREDIGSQNDLLREIARLQKIADSIPE